MPDRGVLRSHPSLNILEYGLETISRYPDREAVISEDGSVRMTFGDVDARANPLANALRAEEYVRSQGTEPRS